MGRILLTGAAGLLGSHLRDWFDKSGRAYVGTDIREPATPPAQPLVLADLADQAAIDALMEDVAAIVHLGGVSRENKWATLLQGNIIGTYNVFDAARRAGVKRIIYASSYHVIGHYPVGEQVDANSPMRPSGLYGVTKAFGETLGRYYFDKFDIECMCIRIAAAASLQPNSARESRIWLSRRDFSSLIDTALDAPVMGFKTVFGLSDNPDAWYHNNPEQTLGWVPQDSSGQFDLPHINAPLDPADPVNEFQGGIWATWPHFDDYPPGTF